MNKIYQNAGRLFFLLLLTNGVGYVGSGFMTPDSMNWYHTLQQSSLTPPPVMFAIVWTILYCFMAVSAFLVWSKTSPRYFVLQLGANLAWTFSFFYLRSTIGSLIIILFLLYFLYKTIVGFYRVSKPSAYLMIPVFLWCMFAFYLNAYVVLYN